MGGPLIQPAIVGGLVAGVLSVLPIVQPATPAVASGW